MITTKVVALMKMCLNNTYNNTPIGLYLSDKLPIHNGVKHGDVLTPVLFIFAVEYAD